MKNSIVELKNYEVENVAGGMQWYLPWHTGQFFIATLMTYRYYELATYETVIRYNKSDHWGSIKSLAFGLAKDLFKFSICFMGTISLINHFIPFIACRIAKTIVDKQP